MPSIALLILLGHIKLTAPESFQVTDQYGNPQKTANCGGSGTASNVVTTVEAGSQLTVTWNETIFHPGHFRLSIGRSASEFITPAVTPDMNSQCGSVPIESTPAYPTIEDGVFVHTTQGGSSTYSKTITVPMMSCENCVLQLMQFMGRHPAPCFYYQCATLKIVMPAVVDAGVDAGAGEVDAGPSITVDAGQPPVMTVDAGPVGGGTGETQPAGCSAVAALPALSLVSWVLRRRRSSRA